MEYCKWQKMMNLTNKVTSNNDLPDKSLLSGIGWCSCSSLSSGVKISICLQLGPQRDPEVVPVKRCRQLWSSSAIAHSFIRTAPLYYPICSYRVSTSIEPSRTRLRHLLGNTRGSHREHYSYYIWREPWTKIHRYVSHANPFEAREVHGAMQTCGSSR